MNHKSRMIALSIPLAVLLILCAGPSQARDTAGTEPGAADSEIGTAFTYQGQLLHDDAPMNATCELTFSLWDEAGSVPTDGTQIGPDVTRAGTEIVNGLFTVSLDFGVDAFDGDARWLQIHIDCNINPATTLWPRQPLTPAPYSIRSENATDADTLDGQHASAFADAGHSHSGDYWLLDGNAGTTAGTHFLGTSDDQALELHVNGNRALRLEPDATSPNIIAGHSGNTVMDNAYGSTIGGGGDVTDVNMVYDHYGVISGGGGNRAGSADTDAMTATYATVGGGWNNTVQAKYGVIAGGGPSNESVPESTNNVVYDDYGAIGGGGRNRVGTSGADTTDAAYATVAGGYGNSARGSATTVSGGYDNEASGYRSTVSGGYSNVATGDYATVPGGYVIDAGGAYSFAAGQRARANNDGCFVWGDSTPADVECNDDNRTIFRSSGGFTIYTSGDLSTSVHVGAGAGSWGAPSDRALKENLRPMDGTALLENLAAIDISTWNYKSQDPAIRHIGPMAQDFNALLPDLGGEGETYINTQDADGIALAAIQGLYQLARQQSNYIETLQTENSALHQRLADLEARMIALEQTAAEDRTSGGRQ